MLAVTIPPDPPPPGWSQAAATVVFALTYLLICARNVRLLNLNRPAAALLGAVLMILVAGLPVRQAYAAVDLNTLCLLLGMMLVASYLTLAGAFEWVAWRIQARAGSPRRLLFGLMAASAALSAIFVNDTICLLMTPLILRVVERRNPVPYLLGLVMAANIGGLATLLGTPQNMLIGIRSGVPFAEFTLKMLPITAASLAAAYAILCRLYRQELSLEWRPTEVPEPRMDRPVALRMAVLCVVLVAALLAPVEAWIDLEPQSKLPILALTAGVAAILLGRADPAKALAAVEWPLLLFFAGLFVVVEGAARTGFLDRAHQALGPLLHSPPVFVAAAAALSNVVSNVPFVVVAQSWIESGPDPERGWLLLAMASTLAGNLTIFGSVANLIVLEAAKDRVRIGFFEYLRAGLPVTAVSLGAGTAFLMMV